MEMTLKKSKAAKGVGKISVSQKVENHIKEAIYKGQLRPRERIIEDDLARRLGVSRGTVREALLRLERDGLIVTTSRRGTFIRDITLEEGKVVFSMRGKLEGLCVRYMREAMRPETRAVLDKALQNMQIAAAANSDEQFFYADMELHHTIWKLSGQPQLFRTLNSVMNAFIFMIARSYSYRFPVAERFEDHKQYVDMILNTPLGRVEREVERYFDKLYRHFSGPAAPVVRPTDENSWLGPTLDGQFVS
jgi:DNA-binding GntR family transcriptional regulator